MKIAHVTKFFYPHRGGIESVVMDVAKALAERSHDVIVLTSNIPKTKSFESLNGIDIYRSKNLFTLSNQTVSPGILVDLFKREFDLIHIQLPDPVNSLFVLIASLIRKKPVVVSYQSDIVKDEWYIKPFDFIYSTIFLPLLLKRSRVLATTPNYIDCSRVLTKFKDEVEVVPNFIDLNRVHIADKDVVEKVKKKYDNKKIVLFVGRLVPYKGIEYLINAHKKVKKKIDCVLLIVGGGTLKEHLKNLIDSSGVSDVHMLGEVSDLFPYYNSCSVLVLPSVTRQEAFGVTLLEAMICSKPTITTNISGMPYVVGDCGITVNPRDDDALSNAIINLLLDENECKRRGKCGRERVLKYFSKDVIIDDMIKVYKEILD